MTFSAPTGDVRCLVGGVDVGHGGQRHPGTVGREDVDGLVELLVEVSVPHGLAHVDHLAPG